MVGESSWGFRVLLGAALLVAACGESTSETQSIAGPDAAVDADAGSADAHSNDVMETGDVVVDVAEADTGADTGADAQDAAVDAGLEGGAAEAGVEAGHPDSGAPLSGACEAAGGVLCTPFRWNVCPVGYEPVDEADGHLSCGSGLGWCCQVAPVSTCSAELLTNCIPGKCADCWQPAVDGTLSCEPGRSCCQDVCK